MSKWRVGLYPGTFDPVTNGHLDIITRATTLVDHLVIGVALNASKSPLFSSDERAEILQAELGAVAPNGTTLEVRSFSSLLMQFAGEVGATAIIRGLRAVSDFEYEFQMAGMNARLNPSIETVFLMASERHQFISSRFVKEICLHGGDVSQFLPATAHTRLLEKYKC